MLTRARFLLLTALSAATLLLSIGNALLFNTNRAMQADIATRGQYIQQSLQLEPVYQNLVGGLARVAAQSQDAQISELLGSQGIGFSVKPTAAGGDK